MRKEPEVARVICSLTLLLFTYSCTTEETPVSPTTYFGLAASLTDDSSVPVVAAHQEGSQVAVLADNGIPSGAVYIGPDGSDFTVWIGEDGLPVKAVTSDAVIVFENYSATSVDLAVVDANGNVEVHREVSLDPQQLSELRFNAPKPSAQFQQTSQLWSWLKIGLLALSVAGCAIAAAKTAGLSLLLLAKPCGSALVGVGLALAPSINPELESSAGAIGTSIHVAGCASGDYAGCIGFLADHGEATEQRSSRLAAEMEEGENLGRGVLRGGYGDVQVTLTWDTTSDIDLWVTDPSGERIYWNHSRSQSGGWLDFDDRDGFGPENVFWESGSAPQGSYLVQVHYFDGNAPTSYRVLVQAFGRSQSFTGVLDNEKDTADIATFGPAGISGKPGVPYLRKPKLREGVK